MMLTSMLPESPQTKKDIQNKNTQDSVYCYSTCSVPQMSMDYSQEKKMCLEK